jgi:hypothetical protein
MDGRPASAGPPRTPAALVTRRPPPQSDGSASFSAPAWGITQRQVDTRRLTRRRRIESVTPSSDTSPLGSGLTRFCSGSFTADIQFDENQFVVDYPRIRPARGRVVTLASPRDCNHDLAAFAGAFANAVAAHGHFDRNVAGTPA